MTSHLSKAVSGVSDEHAARELLRQSGIESLQRRAGYVPECSEAMPIIFDWYPIIKPAYWTWYPTDEQTAEYCAWLDAGYYCGYENGDTWFEYHIWEVPSSKAIQRTVAVGGEVRSREYIDMKNLPMVCLWLAYNEARSIPF